MSAQATERPTADGRGHLAPVCDGTQKTPDGRVRHYFTRTDGQWVCMCGERRDGSGK